MVRRDVRERTEFGAPSCSACRASQKKKRNIAADFRRYADKFFQRTPFSTEKGDGQQDGGGIRGAAAHPTPHGDLFLQPDPEATRQSERLGGFFYQIPGNHRVRLDLDVEAAGGFIVDLDGVGERNRLKNSA